VGQNRPVLFIERMVKGVTKNGEGEKTKVTGGSWNGNSDADHTFAKAGKGGPPTNPWGSVSDFCVG
jgi:hypothetical protein